MPRIKKLKVGKPDFLSNDYLTPEELAEALGVKASTLRHWRRLGGGLGPPITYVGRSPYYFKPTVTAWLRTRERARAATSAEATA